jgi:hypothetical protein
MKNTSKTKPRKRVVRGVRAEYQFDYAKARPNRFAGRDQGDRVVVVLDPDLAEVFTTPESVKTVLRALIETMPPTSK